MGVARTRRRRRWSALGASCVLVAFAGSSCASTPPRLTARAPRRVRAETTTSPPVDDAICHHFYETICHDAERDAREGEKERLLAVMRAIEDEPAPRPPLRAFLVACNAAANKTPVTLLDTTALRRINTLTDVGRALASIEAHGGRPLFALRESDGVLHVDGSPLRFVPAVEPTRLALREIANGKLREVEAGFRSAAPAPSGDVGVDDLERYTSDVPWNALLGTPGRPATRVAISEGMVSRLDDTFRSLTMDDWRGYLALMSVPADVVLAGAPGSLARRAECSSLAFDMMPDEMFELGRSRLAPAVVARASDLAEEIRAAARREVSQLRGVDPRPALDRLDRLRWWLPSASYVTSARPSPSQPPTSFAGALRAASEHWAAVCREDAVPWVACRIPQSGYLWAWADLAATTVVLAPWELPNEMGSRGALYGSVGWTLGHETGHILANALVPDVLEHDCLAEKATLALERAVPASAVEQLQADVVGLRLAVDAMTAQSATTPEDLRDLFVSYARIWCAPNPTIDQMKDAARIPYLQNVHLTLNEIPTFSEAFGCPRPAEPTCASRAGRGAHR